MNRCWLCWSARNDRGRAEVEVGTFQWSERMSSTVSVIKCGSYDREEILEAVRKAVNAVGGISAYLKTGERVLLKPNLLKASRPAAAVTTHPEFIRAMIKLVRETGARPMVGDSPGLGELRRVSEQAGVLAVLDEEQVPLVELDDPVIVRNQGRFHRFEVARRAVEADAIINLPKLKTHGMTMLTGAVKNLFGCVPGKRKVQWHFNTGVDHDSFMRMLVELACLLRPRLTIMDAVIGMEGNGPGSGDPRLVGVVVAGRDPVAVDAVSGLIVGIQPDLLPILRAASAAGSGETRPDHIEVVGEPISAVKVENFRRPPREHPEWQIPEWLKKILKDALTTKPVLDRSACIRCGICQRDCPQKAIRDAATFLEIDYRRCIRCFCCQEFCPQGAITVGKGWMLRMVSS
jgi:uncharacterized protein (DUF362 family)/Pyruvate/2-oxoacid:ferredoxin oxidoreductase delta subunit